MWHGCCSNVYFRDLASCGTDASTWWSPGGWTPTLRAVESRYRPGARKGCCTPVKTLSPAWVNPARKLHRSGRRDQAGQILPISNDYARSIACVIGRTHAWGGKVAVGTAKAWRVDSTAQQRVHAMAGTGTRDKDTRQIHERPFELMLGARMPADVTMDASRGCKPKRRCPCILERTCEPFLDRSSTPWCLLS